MPRTGLGLGLNKLRSAGGFSAAYLAVYDQFTTKPSDAVAEEQNKLVKALQDAGIWETLDVFYLFAQTTNGDGEAQINWVDPGTYDSTVEAGTPVFTALEGMAGNLTDATLSTNLPLGMGGLKYSLNDASYSFYNRVADLSDYPFAGTYLSCQGITGFRMRVRVNDGTSDEISTTTNAGTITGVRSASNVKKGFQNKVEEFSVATASVAVPLTGVRLLSQNGSSFSNAQLSMWMLGSSITKSQHDSLHDAMETYMDSNGKGVVT